MIKLALIFLLIGFLFGCSKDNHCGETAGIGSSGIAVTFFNSGVAKYMYTNVPFYSLYNKDSLIVRDQDGLKISLLLSSNIDTKDPDNPKGYYIFGITPIYNSLTDTAAFTQEVTKTFYIQYNSIERDTLICTFKANRNECNSYFEYLKVYYRNSLIKSIVNDISGGITINKP